MTGFLEGLGRFALPMRPASHHRWLAYALLAIGVSGLVQAHTWHEWYAPIATLSWLAIIIGTLLGLSVPMMMLLGVSTLQVPGVVQSSVLASAGPQRHLTETTYVATHIHYPLLLAAAGIILAAFYHYLPRLAGYRYNEYLGGAHFWMTFIGLVMMFMPENVPFHFLLIPRRYLDYPETFLMWQRWWWYGLCLVALGGLIFAYILVDTYRRKRPV
ncbi:cbb3-type cytochrome c oxidase subunit I [Roseiarcaceae bacterium H3SJ34-1]|uniref:cbb3-type cytochrome c oxidase subunit I n=1 Tax=Terripilifer ovatus TaxID=3032367 RepID=UPI003AB977A6|nr:cbb3-type cytochrome c oxidase subunit I [Roseiarcaceae bacterium H3SJ34-1]